MARQEKLVPLRKQPIGMLNAWDFSLEPGDRVYSVAGNGRFRIFDLRESRSWHRSAAGELMPVLVKKKGKPRLARRIGEKWYWVN